MLRAVCDINKVMYRKFNKRVSVKTWHVKTIVFPFLILYAIIESCGALFANTGKLLVDTCDWLRIFPTIPYGSQTRIELQYL